ncbi:MAG: adenosylcobinamide-phosphate synthase CbiB, partial [Chloroflexota bacterium]
MRIHILSLALAIDLLLGEPPNRWHPVAWMGSLIGWARRRAEARLARPGADPANAAGPDRRGEALLLGTAIAAGGMGLSAGLGWAALRLCRCLPAPLYALAVALLIKSTFSIRGLDRAAGEVQAALEAGDLPEARRRLAWHLVSRDTRRLDQSQVAAAAIESVAENTGDGIVAPLLAAAAGGAPLALAYRCANTADAMLGYHTPQLEWLGKAPARLDDLLNLLPARLSGLLIVLAAPLGGGSPRRAWEVMRRDARLTASPNAGFPMSAMAGALDLRLEKLGHYVLHPGGRSAAAGDIRRARRILRGAAGLALLVSAG